MSFCVIPDRTFAFLLPPEHEADVEKYQKDSIVQGSFLSTTIQFSDFLFLCVGRAGWFDQIWFPSGAAGLSISVIRPMKFAGF